MVTGAHFLDRMLYWFGEPEEFEYFDDSLGGVESTCMARMRFANGVTGNLLLSKAVQLKSVLRLESDTYKVEHLWADQTGLTLYPHALRGTRLHASPESGGPQDDFGVQIDHFARCVRGDATPLIDAWAGARSVNLCERFYAARRQMPEPWRASSRWRDV